MEIIIKGKQGEGKTRLAENLLGRFGTNEGVSTLKITYSGSLKSNLFKYTVRQPYAEKAPGWVLVDAIPKDELKVAKKAVKAVRLTGSKFSVIYVVQQ